MIERVLNMKKEELMKLGLDEETAAKVAAASADELKGFVPKARFDEVNGEKKKAETDLADRDKQLETLRTSTGDVEALKTQIATLQADNKAKDDAHKAEIRQLRIDNAVAAALTDAKARNVKAVKALLNLDNAELADDGTVKGLSDQIKLLMASEDSKFLFDTQGVKKPAMKGAKIGEQGDEGEDHGVDPTKMTYDELCAYLESNPDAQL